MKVEYVLLQFSYHRRNPDRLNYKLRHRKGVENLGSATRKAKPIRRGTGRGQVTAEPNRGPATGKF